MRAEEAGGAQTARSAATHLRSRRYPHFNFTVIFRIGA